MGLYSGGLISGSLRYKGRLTSLEDIVNELNMKLTDKIEEFQIYRNIRSYVNIKTASMKTF